MLQLSGTGRPDPDPRYGAYPQPPIGAGHLSVEYPPRPSAVREARAEVRRQLERWGLADGDGTGADLVETAELLVSELATNALLHSAGRFRLTLSAAHGVLRCEVADSGRRVPQVLDAGTSASGRGDVPGGGARPALGLSSGRPRQDRLVRTRHLRVRRLWSATAVTRPFRAPAALPSAGARPRACARPRAFPERAKTSGEDPARPLVPRPSMGLLDVHGGHHGKHQ